MNEKRKREQQQQTMPLLLEAKINTKSTKLSVHSLFFFPPLLSHNVLEADGLLANHNPHSEKTIQKRGVLLKFSPPPIYLFSKIFLDGATMRGRGKRGLQHVHMLFERETLRWLELGVCRIVQLQGFQHVVVEVELLFLLHHELSPLLANLVHELYELRLVAFWHTSRISGCCLNIFSSAAARGLCSYQPLAELFNLSLENRLLLQMVVALGFFLTLGFPASLPARMASPLH